MKTSNCFKLIALTFIGTAFSFSINAQHVKLDGKTSKLYEDAKQITLQNEDIQLANNREKDNGSLDKITFSQGEEEVMARLINNKLLLNQAGDTIAYYKRSKIHFIENDQVIKMVTLRNGFLNLGRSGWQFMDGDAVIAKLNYHYDKEENQFVISSSYEENNQQAIECLKVALGRFDKQVNMDYDSSSQDIATMVGVMAAFLVVM